MKRQRIRGLIDLFEVTDPDEIKAVAGDPKLDRGFERRTCPVNWLLLERSLRVLSLDGRRFPTMESREASNRKKNQEALWHHLTAMADAIKDGPDELEPLANWVSGAGADADAGILVQQLLGRLFSPEFVATNESWNAARILVAAPRSNDLPKLVWWFLTGELRRAKRLLAGMVSNDLSAVNAIGIAVHNVVRSVHHMRNLYADAGTREALTAEAAAAQSLFAPASVYRQASAAGQAGRCSFDRGSVFVLAIGEACRQPGGRPLVFMDDTWSQCPANVWVPAMLHGVWVRARTQQNRKDRLPSES